MKKEAPMQYRHEIGNAPVNFTFVVRDCFPCTVRSDAVWGCLRDTLPLASPLFQTYIAYNILVLCQTDLQTDIQTDILMSLTCLD